MSELPLAFAYSAGLFATINPCGWAMLPAFVAYYLGSREEEFVQAPLAKRAYDGIFLGLLVTAGFLLIFGGAGFALTAGLRAIVSIMPYASLAVGAALVLLGIWLLAGKSLPVSLPQPAFDLQERKRRTVFLFGIAYGFASLSCTLPVFLAVVGAGLAAASFAAIGVMFLTYGLGMATVLMLVAVGAALFKGSVASWFRGVLPYVHRIGAAFLILAGLYLIWYQGRYLPLIVGGL